MALADRVAAAASAVLARQRYVGPVDVLVELRWLSPTAVQAWRRGRTPDLEQAAAVDATKLASAVALMHEWARALGLPAEDVVSVAGTRDQRPLRFTARGDAESEQAWRTQWTSAEVSPTDRRRIQRQAKPPDLVVFAPLGEFTCSECAGTDDLLFREDDAALCLSCADMDHLVFLGSGDAALTRRAKAASTLSAVVVRFSRSRKRYERQGILVEPDALAAAEAACHDDEPARQLRRERDAARRQQQDHTLVADLTAAIRRHYPGCPPDRAQTIAAHTAARGSGRVGRSEAGQALHEQAITAAVIASLRHRDTDYDRLLMSGLPRTEARDQVRAPIEAILGTWRHPTRLATN